VNLLKCDAERHHNAAGVGQGEAPQHRQASSKNAIVKRLLCVFVGVISFIAVVCVVIVFVTQSSSFEKKSATMGK
jgi:hypothetical protein